MKAMKAMKAFKCHVVQMCGVPCYVVAENRSYPKMKDLKSRSSLEATPRPQLDTCMCLRAVLMLKFAPLSEQTPIAGDESHEGHEGKWFLQVRRCTNSHLFLWSFTATFKMSPHLSTRGSCSAHVESPFKLRSSRSSPTCPEESPHQ